MSRPGPRGPRRGARSAQYTGGPGNSVDAQNNQAAAPQPQEGQARTARTTRQTALTAGTITDIRSRLPERTKPTVDGPGVPTRTKSVFTDDFVEESIAFIKHTQTATFISTRYDAQKKKPGRKALISPLALLVAMHLTVADGQPLLLTVIRQTLLERLSPTMRAMLDIKVAKRPSDREAAKRWERNADALVRRAFHRLLATIDPSTMPKNRKRTWDEIADIHVQKVALGRDLGIAEQEERSAALDWFCDQLLDTAYHHLPEKVRDRLRRVGYAYAIDGTVIESFARGRGIDSEKASTDPDSAWYAREGDHRDPHDVPMTTGPTNADLAASRRNQKRRSPKYIFGREANLLTIADVSHPERLYAPHLPIAFNTSIPGVDPAGGARRTFASVLHRGFAPGYVAGDILYTNQDPAKYQIPAREAGFDLVLGYGSTQTGHQGSHKTGMHLIDGTYMAPCIPDDLIDLIAELRALGTITDLDARRARHKELGALLRARTEYQMRTKEAADPANGIKERLTCPAAGANPTAICALKPRSQKDRPITQPDGTKVDLRRVIDHRKVITKGQAPKVCQQETVTVSIEDGAKYRQSLTFALPEQTNIYNRLRQGTEGVHGTAKDEAKIALANPGRRRVRGWAAMQVFAAFLFAETAVQRIITFTKNAVEDDNGDLYVPRTKLRPETDTPTAGPPGAAPPPLPATATAA